MQHSMCVAMMDVHSFPQNGRLCVLCSTHSAVSRNCNIAPGNTEFTLALLLQRCYFLPPLQPIDTDSTEFFRKSTQKNVCTLCTMATPNTTSLPTSHIRHTFATYPHCPPVRPRYQSEQGFVFYNFLNSVLLFFHKFIDQFRTLNVVQFSSRFIAVIGSSGLLPRNTVTRNCLLVNTKAGRLYPFLFYSLLRQCSCRSNRA